MQIHYLCTIMAKLETVSFSFNGKEYLVAIIPDVISNSNEKLLIGPRSMNEVLFDDIKGYASNEAKYIDEQIYAFIDDEYFSLSFEGFLEKVQLFLD